MWVEGLFADVALSIAELVSLLALPGCEFVVVAVEAVDVEGVGAVSFDVLEGLEDCLSPSLEILIKSCCRSD